MFASFRKKKSIDKLQQISDSIASMPQPKFSLGEIVMAPPGQSSVVGAIVANWEDLVWCYGVSCADNPENIRWIGEAMLVKLSS